MDGRITKARTHPSMKPLREPRYPHSESGRGERRAQRSHWGVAELPATLVRRAAP